MSMYEMILATLRFSTPLLWAGLAGWYTERAGLANLALESWLLVSSFAAASIAVLTLNPWLALAGGICFTLIFGIIWGILVIHAKLNAIVAGVGLQMLVTGLIPLFSKTLFQMSGNTPSIAPEARFASSYPFFVVAILFCIFSFWLWKFTRFGLHHHVTGDQPQTLENAGVSTKKIQWQVTLIATATCAVGGAVLSIVQSGSYIRNMSAGRGYLALVALILSGWHPLRLILTCILFGVIEVLTIYLQNNMLIQTWMPNALMQVMPYILCLLILAIFKQRGASTPQVFTQRQS